MLPTLGANFLNPNRTVPSWLVCSRLSSIYPVGFKGYIEEVLTGVPAFSYNPLTGLMKGLLVEQAGINLIYHSDDMSVSPWTSQYTCNATASAAGDPFLGSSATRIADADTSYRSGRKQSTTVADDLLVRVLGSMVKKDTCSRISLQGAYYGGVTPLETLLELNPTTGDITLGGAGASAVNGYGMEALRDGYFLLWMAIQNNNTGNVSLQHGVYPNGLVSNTPLTDQLACYACGNFLLEGYVPTSRVPTAGASGNRSADLYQVDLSSLMFDPLKGTLIIMAHTPPANYWPQNPCVVCLDGGSSNYLYAGLGGSGAQVELKGVVSGSSVISVTKAAAPTSGILSLGLTYANNSYGLFVNGTKAGSQASGGLPSTLNRMTLGCRWDGTHYWNNPICSFLYFPDVLSDSEIESLTEV